MAAIAEMRSLFLQTKQRLYGSQNYQIKTKEEYDNIRRNTVGVLRQRGNLTAPEDIKTRALISRCPIEIQWFIMRYAMDPYEIIRANLYDVFILLNADELVDDTGMCKKSILYSCAAYKRINMIQYLIDNTEIIFDLVEFVRYCVKWGNFYMFIWTVETYNLTFTQDTSIFATIFDVQELNFIKYAQEKLHYSFETILMSDASYVGRCLVKNVADYFRETNVIPVVEYQGFNIHLSLATNGHRITEGDICGYMYLTGGNYAAQWAVNVLGDQCKPHTALVAFKNGDYKFIKFAIEEFPEIITKVNNNVLLNYFTEILLNSPISILYVHSLFLFPLKIKISDDIVIINDEECYSDFINNKCNAVMKQICELLRACKTLKEYNEIKSLITERFTNTSSKLLRTVNNFFG